MQTAESLSLIPEAFRTPTELVVSSVGGSWHFRVLLVGVSKGTGGMWFVPVRVRPVKGVGVPKGPTPPANENRPTVL